MEDLNQKYIKTISQLKLYTNLSPNQIKTVFENLIEIICGDYSIDEPTVIPYFGSIRIISDKDEVVTLENGKAGRRAKIEIDFEPDPFLSKNIGQVKDDEITDLEKIRQAKIRQELEYKVT